MEAVRVAIDKDLGIKNSYNAQAKKIWTEIKNRILFYQDFTPGQCTTSILETIYNYKWIVHDANNQHHAASMCNSTKCEHLSLAEYQWVQKCIAI